MITYAINTSMLFNLYIARMLYNALALHLTTFHIVCGLAKFKQGWFV